jgi:hypothetical protein
MKIAYRDCPSCGKPESIGVEWVDCSEYGEGEKPDITVVDCDCRLTPDQDAAILAEFAGTDVFDWMTDDELDAMDRYEHEAA